MIKYFSKAFKTGCNWSQGVLKSCGHMIHYNCYKQGNIFKCPVCRSYTSTIFPVPLIPYYNLQFRKQNIQNPVYSPQVIQKDEFVKMLTSYRTLINKQLIIDSSVMPDYPIRVCYFLL